VPPPPPRKQLVPISPFSPLEFTQVSSDFCNICWIDELGSAPLVRLHCSHIFHYSCVKKRLNARWPGPAITFSFSECPLCSDQIEHDSLTPEVEAISQLREFIEAEGIKGLRDEGLSGAEELSDAKSDYYQKPGPYSRSIFVFYECFLCRMPYNGGKHECAQGVEADQMDEKLLRCQNCRVLEGGNCQMHGNQAINYKCRFCCSPATFNCGGGLAHYCDPCHARAGELTKFSDWSTKDKSKLPVCNPDSCPYKGKHSPNGEEFGYCTICVSSSKQSYAVPEKWSE